MNRKAFLVILAASAALVGAGGWLYLRGGMGSPEVLRKLAGARMALEFYRQEKKSLPSDFGLVVASGKLEAVPELKLPGHHRSREVRNTPVFDVKDTGGWAYVSDPSSPEFGLVYIDCSHKDEKSRSWSEF